MSDVLQAYLHREIDLYVFDFCGTVYRSNTTIDFLSYLLRRGSIRRRACFWMSWILAKALKDLRLINHMTYTRIRVRCLRGFARSDLEAAAERFLDEFLAPRANVEVMAFLEDLVASGKRVAMLSNTLSVVLAPFVRRFGISEHYASKLAFAEDGTCLGTYESAVADAGKLALMRSVYDDEDLRGAFFITDDEEIDADLLGFVDHPHVVRED